MTDQTRTAFAPPPQSEARAAGDLVLFPAHRIVRAPVALGPDEVRVEFRGRSKVYRSQAHLERELLAGRTTIEDRVRSWGWLAVLALCAAAVIKGAL